MTTEFRSSWNAPEWDNSTVCESQLIPLSQLAILLRHVRGKMAKQFKHGSADRFPANSV